MPPLFSRLKFAWDYWLRGRHRLPPVELPSDFDYPAPDEFLMTVVADMFTAHGARAYRSGAWIVVDGGRLFVRAAHFDHRQHPDSLVLQSDFVCLTPSGQHIVESFAGIGSDQRSALIDACKSFQDSTFHVLLVTCLDHSCEHVDRESWTIGGTVRALTFGWLRTRGQLPLDLWPPVFTAIQSQVGSIQLPAGLHWVRYFYAHIPGDSPTIEVLVDSEPHPALESAASTLPWPTSDAFYSARLFFTIQDAPNLPAKGETTTPCAP
jgi:hypothetical protein